MDSSFGYALGKAIDGAVKVGIGIFIVIVLATGYGSYRFGYNKGYEAGRVYYDDSPQTVAWNVFYTAKMNAIFYRKIMNTPNDIPNSVDFEKKYLALADKAKKVYDKENDNISQEELDELYLEKDAIQVTEPPITKEQLKILNEAQTELNKEYGYK